MFNEVNFTYCKVLFLSKSEGFDDVFFCKKRMKVPWPMANREAVVQFFLFEYFRDGLVIILLNSVEILFILIQLFLMILTLS